MHLSTVNAAPGEHVSQVACDAVTARAQRWACPVFELRWHLCGAPRGCLTHGHVLLLAGKLPSL